MVFATCDCGVCAALAPAERIAEIKSKLQSPRRRLIVLDKHSPLSARWSIPLEGWRSIYPQQPSLAAARILPAMRHGTLKIETITWLQTIFLFFQLDVQLTAEHVKKLLAFVSV